jgi:hypothetical protein
LDSVKDRKLLYLDDSVKRRKRNTGFLVKHSLFQEDGAGRGESREKSRLVLISANAEE